MPRRRKPLPDWDHGMSLALPVGGRTPTRPANQLPSGSESPADPDTQPGPGPKTDAGPPTNSCASLGPDPAAPANPGQSPAISEPVDALALWREDSTPAAASSLSAIRLDGNERLLVPFTASVLRTRLHYLSAEA